MLHPPTCGEGNNKLQRRSKRYCSSTNGKKHWHRHRLGDTPCRGVDPLGSRGSEPLQYITLILDPCLFGFQFLDLLILFILGPWYSEQIADYETNQSFKLLAIFRV